MASAIFNVEEYEAIHGPIETWDYEAYESKRLNKYYEKRKERAALRKQKVLSYGLLALGTVSSLFINIVPEMYLISAFTLCIGTSLLITGKVVIY